jgi:hypothetical protein
MTDPLNRLLDQVSPPAPQPGFADRIVARATAQVQQPATPEVPRRRDRRGAWMRRPRVFASFIAANLLVASAVAATLAGGIGLKPLREVPVIAPVIEAIAPAPKSRPKTRPAPPVTPVAVAAAAPEAAQAPAAPVRPLPPRIERRMAIGDALAARVEAREAAGLPVPERARKRARLHGLEKQAAETWTRGEPVPAELKTQIVRERIDLAPPRLRERVIERVQERREAGLPVAPALDAAILPAAPEMISPNLLTPGEERMQRWRAMTPAERRQVIERVRARRAARAPGAPP